MTDPVTNSPQHKTVRDKLKEKLLELSEVSGRFGISHSMTIGHIIEDIERITGITDDSWINGIENLKNVYANLYGDIRECLPDDESIDHFSNLTCEFDEAFAEIDALPEVDPERAP